MDRKQAIMVLSDFDIQAYIDNELDWERAKKVIAYIESDISFKDRYDSLLNQKHWLQNWWKDLQRN